MKCKVQRKPEKEREELKRQLVKQLTDLNPKQEISPMGDEIWVKTQELLKLQLPDGCHFVMGQPMQIKTKEGYSFFVIAW